MNILEDFSILYSNIGLDYVPNIRAQNIKQIDTILNNMSSSPDLFESKIGKNKDTLQKLSNKYNNLVKKSPKNYKNKYDPYLINYSCYNDLYGNILDTYSKKLLDYTENNNIDIVSLCELCYFDYNNNYSDKFKYIFTQEYLLSDRLLSDLLYEFVIYGKYSQNLVDNYLQLFQLKLDNIIYRYVM